MTGIAKVVSGILVAGLLAVAMWLSSLKPDLDANLQNPIINRGRIGQVASNRVFDLKVRRVDVAGGIKKHSVLDNNPPMRTSGIFVVVYIDVKSNLKPLTLGHARLTTRNGVTYDETGRVGLKVPAASSYQPMLWGKGGFVFEIPKDRLAGSHMIVGRSDPTNSLTAETDIDLGISGHKAAAMLAHAPADYTLKGD